ncbi:hypothetical protein BCEN4_740079 [Burkholderia cenocepacia]|nr:hypothetical protein BCEN4_740079 [Burkholderia cenocepacia]
MSVKVFQHDIVANLILKKFKQLLSCVLRSIN